MLVAPNLEVLKDYGFEYCIENTYIKYLGANEEYNEVCVSLLVNPQYTEHKENEVFIYVDSDYIVEGIDFVVKCDEIFKLLSKGVIKWVDD